MLGFTVFLNIGSAVATYKKVVNPWNILYSVRTYASVELTFPAETQEVSKMWNLRLAFLVFLSILVMSSGCSKSGIDVLHFHNSGAFTDEQLNWMEWEWLPDSYKDGTLSPGWQGLSDSEKKGKLTVFAVYTSGPWRGKAYRPHHREGGYIYIIRDGKKVYIRGRRNPNR